MDPDYFNAFEIFLVNNQYISYVINMFGHDYSHYDWVDFICRNKIIDAP